MSPNVKPTASRSATPPAIAQRRRRPRLWSTSACDTSSTEVPVNRRYLGPGAVPETLKPDLYAVTASGDYEDLWFVEVDRGTESLPTVLRKCVQYERYRRTGREQADSGLFPFVVWLAPDAKRVAQLRAGIATARDLDNSLFRVDISRAFRDIVTGGAS